MKTTIPVNQNSIDIATEGYKKIKEIEKNYIDLKLSNFNSIQSQLTYECELDGLLYKFHRKCIYGEWYLTIGLKPVCSFDPNWLESLIDR